MPSRQDLEGGVVVPEFRIAIAFPALDKVDARFAHALAELSAYTAAAMLASGAEFEYGIHTVIGTYIHNARKELLENALKENVSHLLWVDSDMVFPKDAMIRLLQHHKTIVGANYSTRAFPQRHVAIKRIGSPGKYCKTTIHSKGLEEVEAVGFGCTLFDMRWIREHMPSKPWFGIGDEYGEDVWFCKRIRQEQGAEIYVDHDLSKEIYHIGSFEYPTITVE